MNQLELMGLLLFLLEEQRQNYSNRNGTSDQTVNKNGRRVGGEGGTRAINVT